MADLEPQSSADVKPFDLRSSNSSRKPSEPVDAAGFDKNASYYDMSGNKYLIILNHHRFEKNKHFNGINAAIRKTNGANLHRSKKNRDAIYPTSSELKFCIAQVKFIVRFERIHQPEYQLSGSSPPGTTTVWSEDPPFQLRKRPSMRNGTYQDERRLKQVFHELGFSIFVLRNMKYKDTIDRLKAIVANLEYTRTSCVCVTILTHGEKGGQICAVDRRYQLSEVMDIFGKEPTLTNKPKLYFVQACRGGNMDAGHTVNLGTQTDSQLKTWPAFYHPEMISWEYSASEESVMMISPPPNSRQADGNFFSGLCDLFMGCGGFSKDSGDTDLLSSQNKSLLTVPSHADSLVVCSTIEDFLSYRDHRGSWMIQALCKSIQNNYEQQNLLDIIIQMHRTVAYDKITNNKRYKEMHKKKQMPETRFTLTKHLKF